MFNEEEILKFWEKNKVFEKSVEQRGKPRRKGRGEKDFVFFEGPPTANGAPGIHHVESRAFKDVVLRYKTMRGYYTPRRAGWDTHGLPVEVEVEKALGLKSKKDIEKYGIAEFNKKCRESVWKYKELWEKLTERMGFWIDMANAYITYENSYIESLWGIIKEFAKRKLLYEDYKVMPWCARCGTALSSHELAQGYEKIKENSIYVKFKLKPPLDPLLDKEGKGEVYFLVWTTTPWTLPGNVALAVNPKVGYVILEMGSEKFVVGSERASVLGSDYKIEKELRGEDLIGLRYEPLYPLPTSNLSPPDYSVVAGDFVSTEDGTGIVHIAPAYGDDDFNIMKKYHLDILNPVGKNGLFQTPGKKWYGVWFKKADPLIIEDLKNRGLLFKEEKYEHDYPFCWRCKEPLMYLARKSWWVDVNKVRDRLLENNQKINWLPAHIKEGRMGEWLKEKKNWAFSRERYWGTPLPVWKCGSCGAGETAGSIDELKKRGVTSGNKYFMMRHGEAETNVNNITNSDLKKNHYHLTAKGKKQAEETARSLAKRKVKPDLILTSPFLRTRETADIVAKILGVSEEKIIEDRRLGEVNTGVFSEGNPKHYHAYFSGILEKFTKAPPGGETLADLKKRMWETISEIKNKYRDKTILIVSHEYPLWMLSVAADALTNEQAIAPKVKGDDFVKTGEWRELEIKNIPRDENLILDLHRPYIDEIKLRCDCGSEMQRVPEVVDVWFDSGAMPFASVHWPFGEVNIPYPADYITEAIDQTRGWFYTLLAVATLLDKGEPYKNIISLGHVLDAKGKKMSKSLGNVADPMALIEKYGADAVRWYFFTINQPWDSKLFKEDDVKDAQRRFFMILWNVLRFWKMYAGKGGRWGRVNPSLLISKWVLAKLAEVTGSITKKLDAYDIVGAARELENFVVEDVSRWYIRRIRDVMKTPTSEVGAPTSAKPSVGETSAVLAYLLGEISKLLAPFAPFTAEKIWMEVGNKNSVHLEDWSSAEKRGITHPLTPSPRDGEKGGGLLSLMEEARRIVSLTLEARAKAGIKVRQPLAKLEIQDKKVLAELLNLIKDEVNVKKIVFDPTLKDEVRLDTTITPELREEGILRDLIREIQAARKTAGLKPKDKVTAQISLPKEILEAARKNQEIIEKETSLKSAQFAESPEVKVLLKK